MPFTFTAAPSSRIGKPTKRNPFLQRSSSSPFASHPRRKPSLQSSAKPSLPKSKSLAEEQEAEPLDDRGPVTTLATDQKLRNVEQYLRYIADSMFDDIPDRAGMNSTRISEVLRYRIALPPLVRVTHVHALCKSPTAADRETAELVQKRTVRRLTLPDRGLGNSATCECLVLTEDWVKQVEQCTSLGDETKARYISILREHPDTTRVSASLLSPLDISGLKREGFLTLASNTSTLNSVGLDTATQGTLTSLLFVGSRAASGSMAAVGGDGAVHNAGGSGRGNVWSSSSDVGPYLSLCLPSVGPYLRLLAAARSHLVSLLARSKYREAPLDLLRKRWDGAVASTALASRSVGLAGSVLPGKTKRWKEYFGLRFHWVLEECLGSGLVEVFDTGSVGLGVRLSR